MTTLTIRMPDNKAARIKTFAKKMGISVNKLIEELATIGLVQLDAESRFSAMAANGSAKKGIAILDELETLFKNSK